MSNFKTERNEDFGDFSEPSNTLNSIYPLIDVDRTTGNGYYVSHRKYPTGDIEIVAIFKGADDPLFSKGGKRKNEEKEEMDKDTLRRSQSRARRTIKRKALCLQADRLMTLTYKENKDDLKECWKDFQKFARKMKARYPEFRYVVVPEYQKRGAVHFHLAVSGYYHANTVRRIWKSVVGEGNIDITSPRKAMKKASWNPKRIAGYLAKYLTKNETVDFNQRRYSTGGGIPEPERMTGWLAMGLPVGGVLKKLAAKTTRKSVEVLENIEKWNLFYLST